MLDPVIFNMSNATQPQPVPLGRYLVTIERQGDRWQRFAWWGKDSDTDWRWIYSDGHAIEWGPHRVVAWEPAPVEIHAPEAQP